MTKRKGNAKGGRPNTRTRGARLHRLREDLADAVKEKRAAKAVLLGLEREIGDLRRRIKTLSAVPPRKLIGKGGR